VIQFGSGSQSSNKTISLSKTRRDPGVSLHCGRESNGAGIGENARCTAQELAGELKIPAPWRPLEERSNLHQPLRSFATFSLAHRLATLCWSAARMLLKSDERRILGTLRNAHEIEPECGIAVNDIHKWTSPEESDASRAMRSAGCWSWTLTPSDQTISAAEMPLPIGKFALNCS